MREEAIATAIKSSEHMEDARRREACSRGRQLSDRLETMKNIQVIDGGVNCVYDIFAATEDEFALIFRTGQDVAFAEDVWAGGDPTALEAAFANIWRRRVVKATAPGIHGTLFYGLPEKKIYYPTLIDGGAVNPDGSRLR